MSKDRKGLAPQIRATIKTDSYDKANNTIDVVFVTESPVEMEEDGQRFIEILSCNPAHVRLERIQAGAPFLKVHNPNELENQIGVVHGDVWFENNEGWAKIRLSKRPDCAGVVGDIIEGIIKNISVGYDVLQYENLGTNERGLPILKAIDWEPAEISATPIPADYKATTRSRYIQTFIKNSKNRKMAKTREEKIRSLAKRFGVDDTVAEQMIADGVTVEDALETIMDLVAEAPAGDGEGGEGDAAEGDGDGAGDGARSAEDGEGDGEDDGDGGEGDGAGEGEGKGQRRKPGAAKPVKSTLATLERQRAATIFKAVRAGGLDNNLALDLIEKGTSQARAMEIIVNKMAAKQKPTNARVNGRDETVTQRNAMEQALLYRAAPGTNKLTIDKAKEYSSFSLLDYGKEMLEQKGHNTRGMSKAELTTRALSTSDFPALLGGVTNKILRKAYEQAPQTWKPLAAQKTASDFRDIYGVQVGGSMQLEEVKEGGEYKQDTMKESEEKFRVKTYGKIITITRQAIINDDLNGFSRVSQQFGNSAANKESDIMWGLILNNPKMADGKALFHVDHKNLGTAAALSLDGLSAGAVSVMRQTGLDAKEVLNLYPKYLIVSPEQLILAKKLMADVTSTKSDDVNPLAGAFDIIWDQRLTDAKAWFLGVDPSSMDGLVYAYLTGHEGLYTEQREGFETDGIQIKARLDFGGGLMDYRGLYKNPGQ